MDSKIPEKLLNRLHRGSIFDILPLIPDNSVDCIFADPDYNVGVRYQGTSYTRSFKEYIDECVRWSRECHRVLKEDGNFFIVNYGKNSAYLRTEYLDSAFSNVYEYVWVYRTNIGFGKRHFTTAHRIILHCTKSHSNRFYKDRVAQPYQNPTDRRIRKLLSEGSPGRMPYSWIEMQPDEHGYSGMDWFEFNLVKNVGRTKTFHSCQIPERLSEMLFTATCSKGDTVLVLFGGAGSELAVCQRLGLNWISAEKIPEYCDLIESRLGNNGNVPQQYRLINQMKSSSGDRK